VDGALMRAAFPMGAIEQAAYWKDLMRLGTTVVFERIVLVSRYTAHTQYVPLFDSELIAEPGQARLGACGTR
jgi:hypothetical protein